MLSESLQKQDYKTIIKTVARHLQSNGYSRIKADLPESEESEYEKPAKFLRKGEQNGDGFIPNLTAIKDEEKCYFEIVPRKNQDKSKLLSKWRMLSAIAEMRSGRFYLVVPNGKLRYTRQILSDEGEINAEVLQLKLISAS